MPDYRLRVEAEYDAIESALSALVSRNVRLEELSVCQEMQRRGRGKRKCR